MLGMLLAIPILLLAPLNSQSDLSLGSGQRLFQGRCPTSNNGALHFDEQPEKARQSGARLDDKHRDIVGSACVQSAFNQLVNNKLEVRPVDQGLNLRIRN